MKSKRRVCFTNLISGSVKMKHSSRGTLTAKNPFVRHFLFSTNPVLCRPITCIHIFTCDRTVLFAVSAIIGLFSVSHKIEPAIGEEGRVDCLFAE